MHQSCPVLVTFLIRPLLHSPRRPLRRNAGHSSPPPGHKPRSDMMTDTPPVNAGLSNPSLSKTDKHGIVFIETGCKIQWRMALNYYEQKACHFLLGGY